MTPHTETPWGQLTHFLGRVSRKLGTLRTGQPPVPYQAQFSADRDLPTFEGTPTLYMMATTPRCGSHFLGHALAECETFGVPLEYLHPGNMKKWHGRFGTRTPEEVLAELIRHRTGPTGHFGFKAHWSQFDPYQTCEIFAPHGGLDRAFWIFRRDLLGQAISFVVANQTGVWISGAPKQGEASYDYAKIVKFAADIRDQNAHWKTWFDTKFKGPVHKVVYEELIADQTSQLRAAALFVDANTTAHPAAAERTQKQSNTTSETWRQRFHSELRPEDSWVLEDQAW